MSDDRSGVKGIEDAKVYVALAKACASHPIADANLRLDFLELIYKLATSPLDGKLMFDPKTIAPATDQMVEIFSRSC
jgi:hypothetical protein